MISINGTGILTTKLFQSSNKRDKTSKAKLEMCSNTSCTIRTLNALSSILLRLSSGLGGFGSTALSM